MDSITQAVLGAGIAGAVLGPALGRRALWFGAVLGTVPDLDVLQSYPDPVSTMTFHRGWSHSIFVLTAASVLLAGAVQAMFPPARFGMGRLFLTIWLVLITHPLLDAFTSYGTQLFWPLPWTPANWSSIFIIDPVYTVPMLIAVIVAGYAGITPRAWRGLCWSLGWGCLYLAFSIGGKYISEARVHEALVVRGIQVQRIFSSPMPLNTLLWRVVVDTGDGSYIEAVSGLFDARPPELLRQPFNRELARPLAEAPLHRRLSWFTDNWLRYDQIGSTLVVTDLRMGIPGFHTFRFSMATQQDGRWQILTPARWPSEHGDMALLRRILRRAVADQPPLPLLQWSLRNAQAQD
jgi:inner membrane protein